MAIQNITMTISKYGLSLTTAYAVINSTSSTPTKITVKVLVYVSTTAFSDNKQPIFSESIVMDMADLDFTGSNSFISVLENHLSTLTPYSTGSIT